MSRLEVRRIEFPEIDEAIVTYGGRPISDLPRFKKARFSSRLFYSDERVFVNILTASLTTIGFNVKTLERTGDAEFIVGLSNGSTALIEVRTIATRDLYVTEQIQDLSAGLSEWAYEDASTAERLRETQISFIIPEFSKDSELDDAWVELRQYLSEHDFTESTPDALVPVPRAYRTLTDLNARILVRHAGPSFVQITQGARAVASPAIGTYRLMQQLRYFQSQALERGATEQWLILWFQSLYEPFSVETARPMLEEADIAPYRNLIIADGRELGFLSSV